MVQVRRAHPRDVEGAAKLCADAAIEDGGHCVMDADRIKAHGFGANALFEVWVAEEPRVKGFCGCAVITTGYDVRRALPTVIVGELYVAPSHRRAGVARIIMSALARRAMELGAREVSITTGVHKDTAKRFFDAIGAHAEEAKVFKMSADGIQWLASESA